MAVFIILLILLLLFSPAAGFLAIGGIGSVLIVAIPVLIVAGILLLILVKYFDYREAKKSKKEEDIRKYNRKMGIVTEHHFNLVVQDYEQRIPLDNILPYRHMSDAQKKTVLIKLIKKYHPLNGTFKDALRELEKYSK